MGSTMESKVIEIPGQVPRQPLHCQPPDLAASMGSVCERIRKLRGRPLLALAADFIDDDFVEALWQWRKQLRQAALSRTVGIDVLINSPGGELNSCFTVARLLSRWLRNWEALVPAYATSGGTLICLGASKIVMSERAHLGLMGPLQAFFNSERASAFEAVQSLRQLRDIALESIEAGVEFLMGRKVSSSTALETAVVLARALVEPVVAKIDPAEVARFSADSVMALDYCTRVARPEDAARQTQRNVDLFGLIKAQSPHECVLDLDAAKVMNFEAVEADMELEDLFDELRPLLAKVSRYVNFIV